MSGRIYSEEEKMAYVEEFKNSGLGSTAFAKEIGVPESTLRTWVREDRNLSFGAIEIQPSNGISQKNFKRSMVREIV